MSQSQHAIGLAAIDIGIGGLLYQQVSAGLGVLLVTVGLAVLASVTYETAAYHCTALWRRAFDPATD